VTTPCNEWKGRRDSNGYGRVGKCGRAHRIAWELVNGPIPSGLFVCHRCDNPACVRVDHLFLGTSADNNRDRHAKGRSRGLFPKGDQHPAVIRRGERHWAAKLSAEAVAELRRRRAKGESTVSLAKAFGINSGTVSRIARGIWRTEVT
jgi:hypothetical protein